MFGIDFKTVGLKNIAPFFDKQVDDKKIGELADVFFKNIPLEGVETSHVAVAATYSDGSLHVSIYGAYHACGVWQLTRCKQSYSFKNFIKKIMSYAG